MNITGKMNNKMKLVIIAVVAVLVIIAVTVTVIVVKSKSRGDDGTENITSETSGDNLNENNSNFEPVTFTEDVTVTFDGASQGFGEEFENHQMETSTTVAYKPNTQTTNKQPSAGTTAYHEKSTEKTNTPSSTNSKVMADIDSFFNGVIYFDGITITDGSTAPMEFAMNGSDFHIFSEMEGKDIAILNCKGKLYIMNPDSMKYTEINAAVKSMMGVSEDDFKFEFTKVKFDGKAPTSVTYAKYDGKDAVCYTYKNEKDWVEFISVGNEVKQMTQYASNGTAKTVLQADEFTSEIPSDMLSFQGYSKTNIISFMKDFM